MRSARILRLVSHPPDPRRLAPSLLKKRRRRSTPGACGEWRWRGSSSRHSPYTRHLVTWVMGLCTFSRDGHGSILFALTLCPLPAWCLYAFAGESWVEEANRRRGNEDTLEKTLFVRLARLGVTPLLLGRQYRCHPRLSGLASRLFYGGRCEPRFVFPGCSSSGASCSVCFSGRRHV